MEFICVSRIAKVYRMDVTDVFLQVQQELFDNGYEWGSVHTPFTQLDHTMTRCHMGNGGLVLIIEGYHISYASEEYCCEEYGEYTLEEDSIPVQPLTFKLKLDKVVQLEGTYTKKQLEEILKGL